MTFRRTRLATLVVGLCCFFLLTSQAPSPCAGLPKEIADLKAERAGLQDDLKKAPSPGAKPAIASQIKKINQQIAAKEKQLEKCQCSGPLDGKFKLPFDNDPAWALCNGNWDDPIHGHGKGEPNGEKSAQAYAFDFVYSPNHNCQGTEGHNIRAMRAGTVIASASDRTCNVWKLKAGDPCYGKPAASSSAVAGATALIVALFALNVHAAETSDVTTAAEAFARLKALSGSWSGHVMTPDGPAAKVDYGLAGNGSVVMETLFPGTQHEMITMYTLDGNDLVATHYCSMGNQPTMKLDLSRSTSDRLVFGFIDVRGKHGDHIHDGVIRFLADDSVVEQWNSSASEAKRFFLNRAR